LDADEINMASKGCDLSEREKKRETQKTPKGTLMEFGKRPKVDQRDINILVP
jgi:hypothetical protein